MRPISDAHVGGFVVAVCVVDAWSQSGDAAWLCAGRQREPARRPPAGDGTGAGVAAWMAMCCREHDVLLLGGAPP